MRVLGKWAGAYSIVLGAALLMAGTIFAQDKSKFKLSDRQQQQFELFVQDKKSMPASMSPDDIVAKMKEKLNLSDEQVLHITPIVRDDLRQRNEIIRHAKVLGADRDTIKSRMAALRESTKAQLAQYLTPEQLERLQNNQPSEGPAPEGDGKESAGGEPSKAATDNESGQ